MSMERTLDETTKQYIFELIFNEPTYRFSTPLREQNKKRKVQQLKAMYNADAEFYNAKYVATNFNEVMRQLYKKFHEEEE